LFRHKADSDVPLVAYLHWFLMAASAGFTNAAAFFGLGMFVTHVTGVATLFGVHAAQGEMKQALTALAVLFFFLLGSMLAGLLLEMRRGQGIGPRYDLVMAVAGFSALAPALLHRAGFEGCFGLSAAFIALVLLCFSSGMQNAALGAASGHSVRVSHLTGLTTDLGLGLARLLAGTGKAAAEAKLNWLRAGTIAAFLLGAYVGAQAWLALSFSCFWIPALLCFYAAWRGRLELTA
jgi:uncharacterized membrane protein YoaK (UPF0700 family)